MRYFTMAWWGGIQADDTVDPRPDYDKHLKAIRHRLPPDLITVRESLPLHDARLRKIIVRPADETAQLVFDNYAGDEQFILTYTGIEQIESTADPKVGLGGPYGYGDLGYDELDVLPTGAIEHRFLFSSGIELAIGFHNFGFTTSRKT